MSTEEYLSEQEIAPTNFSLLYPPEVPGDQQIPFLEPGPAALHDLGVEQLVAAFSADQEHQKEIQKLFIQLPLDPGVIVYRQDILDDLLANPELVERFVSLFPVIDSLFRYSYRSGQEMSSLHEVIWRTGELQNIIDCVQGFGEIFDSIEGKYKSEGLRILQEDIRKTQNDPTYQSLVRELPVLLSKLRTCASITIGVNLDPSLHPVQATLLSVNDNPFTDQSLLNRLFGMKKEQAGITPLHSVPQRAVDGPYALPITPDLGWAVEPQMVLLFADLAKVLEKTTTPIAKQLKHYAKIHSRLFTQLHQG